MILDRRGKAAPPKIARETKNGCSYPIARTSNPERELVAIQPEEVVRNERCEG